MNIINSHQEEIVKGCKENGSFLPCLKDGEKLFTFSINFAMDSGDSLQSVEKDKKILEDEHYRGSVFGARIFSHFFFCGPVNALAGKLGTPVFEMVYRAGVFKLNNVMRYISKRLHSYVGKQHGGRSDTAVILTVIADEYQVCHD